jgi:glycosyltransferase involved in cell wall biosynthesis
MSSGGFSATVVIAVRDGERYLGEALDSVLAQTAPHVEVVVVDDGSADGTATLASSYGAPVRVVAQEQAGQASAINRGVTEATADVVSFLDHDDVWPPNSLERRLERLAAGGTDCAVFGRVEQFLSPELDAQAVRVRFDPGPRRVDALCTMAIRRPAFSLVGPLDERLASGAVVDWVSRAVAAGVRVLRIDDVVLRRRIHGGNWGLAKGDRARAGLLEVVRVHHRRTRGAP